MYFVAVGVVLKALTHVLQENLCVFGCSPIIIILVAFCCMYWVELCHVLACLWPELCPLVATGYRWCFQSSVLCLVSVVPTKYLVVHVRWGLLASNVEALVLCYV